MLARAAGLVAAAALLLAGCGGGGNGGKSSGTSTTTSTSTASAKRLLAAAPAKVAKAHSSRVSFDITVQTEQLGTISLPGGGEFDYSTNEGRLTMDVGELLQAAGQSGGGEIEVLAKGDVYYIKYPLFSKALGTSKPWIRFRVSKLGEITGFDVSSLRQLNQGDPTQTLVYLKAAGTVEAQGSEQIDGADTTKYHAVVDLDRVPAQAPASKRAAVRSAVASLKTQYGISKLPLDVWIDGHGLPRRLYYKVETESQGQNVQTQVRMDLKDYGTKVDVSPPPSSQVADLSDLA